MKSRVFEDFGDYRPGADQESTLRPGFVHVGRKYTTQPGPSWFSPAGDTEKPRCHQPFTEPYWDLRESDPSSANSDGRPQRDRDQGHQLAPQWPDLLGHRHSAAYRESEDERQQ